jgi:hypothetical protein
MLTNTHVHSLLWTHTPLMNDWAILKFTKSSHMPPIDGVYDLNLGELVHHMEPNHLSEPLFTKKGQLVICKIWQSYLVFVALVSMYATAGRSRSFPSSSASPTNFALPQLWGLSSQGIPHLATTNTQQIYFFIPLQRMGVFAIFTIQIWWWQTPLSRVQTLCWTPHYPQIMEVHVSESSDKT